MAVAGVLQGLHNDFALRVRGNLGAKILLENDHEIVCGKKVKAHYHHRGAAPPRDLGALFSRAVLIRNEDGETTIDDAKLYRALRGRRKVVRE